MIDKNESIIGCLLGTAVGDAIGLPYEGLSKARQQKIYPKINKHRLFFGKGMFSDDTEHTCMVAQSLLVSGGEEKRFSRALAWRLRFWLLGLPAGVGYATLRAILKLWLGFPPHRSGVFSAGNGPAMRSGIIGVCYGQDRQKLRSLVKASTLLTHSDRKAEYGALAVAIAAYLASSQSIVEPEKYYRTVREFIGTEAEEFLQLIKLAVKSAAKKEKAELFAAHLGLNNGISGYIYHTVPVVIQIWLRHQRDYRGGIREIIKLGGDTDTTAAILGGIIGAAVGKTGIPQPWREDLWEFPRNIEWMEALGRRLAKGSANKIGQPAFPLSICGTLLRNLFFLLIVIFHGFRRLFPPY